MSFHSEASDCRRRKCCRNVPVPVPAREVSAKVTSSHISVFDPPNPPVIDFMQLVPVDPYLFGPFASNYVQFDQVEYQHNLIWDNIRKAFIVTENGRYVVSWHLIAGTLPNSDLPLSFPDSWASFISVHDPQDNLLYVSTGDERSGTPNSQTPDGLGLIVLNSSDILNLEKGQIVRLVIKCVKNPPGVVVGFPVLAGQIQTVVPGGPVLLKSSTFAISQLANDNPAPAPIFI